MEDGFYWLRINGDWVPAVRESSLGWWMVVGSDIPYWFEEVDKQLNHEFEIGPRLEPPND